MIRNAVLASCAAFFFTTQVQADTPANCMIEDIYGEWTFFLSKPTPHHLSCDKMGADDVDMSYVINLDKPNLANVISPENGESGHWTMIYNQGFEVEAGLHKFFAFFWWAGELPPSKNFEFNCKKTVPGWANDILGKEHRCFVAVKGHPRTLNDESDDEVFVSHEPLTRSFTSDSINRPFQVDTELVARINQIPDLTWTTDTYENEWKGMSIKQAKSLQGSFQKPKKNQKLRFHPLQRPVSEKSEKTSQEQVKHAFTSPNADKEVPSTHDWRNVDGKSYVSPVRHQDMCGSCYAFASAGEVEARIRIATDNVHQPILSTQQVVDCSPYSQGCEGGFPYLVAGKWGQDYGFVEESAYPYEGQDKECRDPGLKEFIKNPENIEFHDEKAFTQRYYSAMYRYVGGYFGNCNEESMKAELFRHGPIAVGFEVLDDFRYYKNGIYRHTGLTSRVNNVAGLEETNHAVLIVGYGHCDKENLDFWIVKNSWGDKWGEEGYFRIVRGEDNVAIESMAAAAYVIPPF